MTKLTHNLIAIFFILNICYSNAQEKYFPERGEWKKETTSKLDFTEAVQFAMDNEYSQPKDLRQAILKGFENEPYHEILGPTKRRGGPAGMIIKDGEIITEWGDTKRVDMTFSVTKSFLSTMALLALDQNLIKSVTEEVKNYVWDDKFESPHNSKITWEHLLQQTSDWSGNLWDTYDWADRPSRNENIDNWRSRTLNEPGTTYKYNDVRVNLLAYSLLQVFREPLPQVLKRDIMDKIGASSSWRWFGYENSFVTLDGLKMQSVSGGGHSGGGLFINTEDMARFGLLFLNNGNWNGEQLISKNQIDKALIPSTANPNYGYMWWLNQKGSAHWEGHAEHIYYAAGFGGNFIIIDKENNMVIVTRWLEPSQIKPFMDKVYKSI